MSKIGQYFTPDNIAGYMASLFSISPSGDTIRILDPGAGKGILSYRLISRLSVESNSWEYEVTLYEIDKDALEKAVSNLRELASKLNLNVTIRAFCQDFLKSDGVNQFDDYFDYIILNPPYGKIPMGSDQKKKLLDRNIRVSNLYAAFVLLSSRLLKGSGELVSITPRSFINGTSFKLYRKELLHHGSIELLHSFKNRKIFGSVLQEVMIMKYVKDVELNSIQIRVSDSKPYPFESDTLASKEDVIDDSDFSIKIIDKPIIKLKETTSLGSLQISGAVDIYTGPVVAFRDAVIPASKDKKSEVVPYIFPRNFDMINYSVNWPLEMANKENFLVLSNSNLAKLRNAPIFVLIKRFSSMEQKKRIQAVLYLPETYQKKVAFDNKINVVEFKSWELLVARGLCMFLNSVHISDQFRQISGSTQVNVSDLLKFQIPKPQVLKKIGTFWTVFQKEPAVVDKIIFEIMGEV
ncbi:Eco57I restriction-modification methylase domain-containing protein [uncultured Secundilactobacillus sp.]|uniref:Eco57I restriction-modification methylase domain-containing protein n=1 Tax=uncultured Secundilactobacillus sp. TaxID=2813935 RepID=UPI00258E73C3|nr:Eco57I restriction-modification methylase domain-containing protein [uncultured Secundilactobacillus sp.]